MDAPPALRVKHLSKTFPGQRALDDVSLDVMRGEVHALLGENGSGKSTLIKCLAGFHEPDDGASLEIDGERLALPLTPSESIAHGLAFVHQDLGLIPTLSVMENLSLSQGFVVGAGKRIRWREEHRMARQSLERLGVEIEPRRLISALPLAERTLVAIARAMRGSESARVVVLDEPTAALPSDEVARLFAAVREMTNRGIGVLYVSHRLPEVMQLADRATVLRDGRQVASFERASLTEDSLVSAIVGRSLDRYYPDVVETHAGEVVLETNGLSGDQVQEINLRLRAGEILGIAGLLGSGRSELARLLAGAQAPSTGTITVGGRHLAPGSTKDALAAGVVMVPEDRRGSGAFMDQTLQENLTLPALPSLTRHGRIQRRAERARAERLVKEFDVRPPQLSKRFGLLSGGNQQKAIIARWLSLEPKVIVLDEPVQGVDIGSRTEIYEIIRRAADAGAAVVLIDSELEDLARLADRVLVMARGRVSLELGGDGLTRDEIVDRIFSAEGNVRDKQAR